MDRSADPARPLDVLCADIVERYHASLHRTLPRIGDELTALSASGGGPAIRAVRIAFAELAQQIEGHLAKEERLLFPALEALAAAERSGSRRPSPLFVTVLHPIRLMEAEHVRIEAALDALGERALEVAESEGLQPGWRRCLIDLAQLEHDLREHHHVEDAELFPRALELERRLMV